MSDNKIDIDGVRFKVEADLSKLDQDLKKGETNAKKGGENLGQAAGKGFDAGLKENVKKTLDDVKKESDGASSSLMGIFGKVGGAIAGAFALDKVVGFFKDCMKYADEVAEEMGGVSQATQDINDDFEKMSKNGVGFWNSIKLAIGNTLNNIVTGFKSLAVVIADTFNGKSADRIIELYGRQKESLKSLSDEMQRLSSINNRTATEELKLIELKEQLSARAKKLGIDYDELTRSGMSYLEMLNRVADIERNNARRDIYRNAQSHLDTAATRYNQAGVAEAEAQRLQDPNLRPGNLVLYGSESYINARIAASQRRAIELRAAGEAEMRAYQDNINRLSLQQESSNRTPESTGGATKLIEQRFIETQKSIAKIVENFNSTIKKIGQDFRSGAINLTQKENREKDAGDDLSSRLDYEKQASMQMYAEYIEERYTANKIALDRQMDDQTRASREALNAEFITEEEYETRIQEIREANARKNAMLYAESFAQTMQAAQATTTGFVQLTKAKDIGSSLSAQGNVLRGLSGFKDIAPSLKVLGPIGDGIGALGGIFSAIMGDSEAKAAERARQQAERDAAALKTLQSQEKYQKDLLEFQKAQANLPFKDLQRELRVIDLQTQQKRLSGMPADQAEAERLQRTSGAISGVLQSEADKFTGGVFFKDSARSPEALSAALGDVDKYGPSMNLLSSIMSEVAATRGESAEKIGFDFYNQRLSKVQSLDLPPELKQAASDFIVSVAAAGFYRNARDGGINTENDYMLSQARVPGYSKYAGDIYNIARSYESMLGGRGINTSTSNVDNLISEFQADAGMIENLFGLFEKLNQTNLQIQENTGKTASNTEKLVETPTRSSSLIDITRGFTRSLGQNMLPSSLPMGLPDSVHSAALAIDIQKSLEERSLNKLEDLVSINRDQREFLAIISKSLVAGSSADAMTRMQLEDLYRRSIGGIAA